MRVANYSSTLFNSWWAHSSVSASQLVLEQGEYFLILSDLEKDLIVPWETFPLVCCDSNDTLFIELFQKYIIFIIILLS